MSAPTVPERFEGGLWGLLVGDALGVPYEFHDAADLPPREQLEMEPPRGFRRAHAGVPPGTWSDDGAQALCLLDSLLYKGFLDLEDFGRRLVNWRDMGYLAVDHEVFDVGMQTTRALDALRSGTPAALAGPKGEKDNGNGSLMRVLPIALWHRGSDEALIGLASQQSLPTHGHVRAQVCCALYCLWARRTLQGVKDPWEAAVRTLRSHLVEGGPHSVELEEHVRPDDPSPGTGSGYVVDTLRSARAVMEAGDYAAVVRAAIALGRDTDTTACVAGGIAGLRDGVQGIPERWREALRGKDLLQPLWERLVKHHTSGR